jgi:hypothetical protein
MDMKIKRQRWRPQNAILAEEVHENAMDQKPKGTKNVHHYLQS